MSVSIGILIFVAVAVAGLAYLSIACVLAFAKAVRKATLNEVADYLERNAASEAIAKNGEIGRVLKGAAIYVRGDYHTGAFLHLAKRVGQGSS